MNDQFKKLDPPVVVAYGAGVPQTDPRLGSSRQSREDQVLTEVLKLRKTEVHQITLYGVLMELRANFRKVMAELSQKYKGGISEEDANYAFERVLNDFLMKNAFGDRVLP